MRRVLGILVVLSVLVVGIVGATGIALAAPHQGNPGADFVCPVITNPAVADHNPIASPIGGGDYTVVPSTSQAGGMNVPDRATNGNGTGTPGGAHSAPGDTDYTAIWNGG